MAAGRFHGLCSPVHWRRPFTDNLQAIQTALIGSLASVGINDKAQAIVTIVILATTITPPQLLAFVM